MTRTYDRRAFLRRAGLVGGALVSLSGCTTGPGGSGGSGGGSGSDDDDTVDMNDSLDFVPASLTVPVGTTVTWTNVGSVGHSVTAYEAKIPDGAAYFASGGFDSEREARNGYPATGNLTGGQSYEHTFETPGTYEYFCIPHESAGMVGTVEVTG